MWRKKNGEILHTIVSPKIIYDKKSVNKGSFATFTDITERVEAEENEAFLDTLLRHDILNKIVSIKGYLTILDHIEAK